MLSLQSLPKPNLLASIEFSLAAFVVYYIGWIIYARFFHPLKDIPGPFLASISGWWYFRAIRYGIAENSQLPLHKKYGKFVRINPNEVSIADAAALEMVFGTKPRWQKTEFYDSFNPRIGDRVEIFSTRDENLHTERRRIVAHLFTPGAVLEYEPRVNRVVEVFLTRLDAAAASNEKVDMSRLLRQFTLDVISEIFYGKEGGFLSLRDDIDYKNWMAMLDVMIAPVSSLSYVPKGIQTLYFMIQLLSSDTRKGLKAFQTVIDDSRAIVKQRVDEAETRGSSPSSSDMLSKMLSIVSEKGSKIDFNYDDVAVYVYDSIMAGSDTTAINLTNLFYHVVKDRRVYGKLVDEIQDAFATGKLSHPIRYNDAIKLKYLDACIKETLRYAPGSGTGFPRYVPAGGATIAGRYFPGGCKVIMNGHVVHFDKDCFGEDAEVFRPERWIDNDPKTVANMSRHEFTFGTGPRICIGKHLALVEFYKVLPALLNEFDFELLNEWTVQNHWFRRVSNVNMKVSKRK